jgi:hypothetical protein
MPNDDLPGDGHDPQGTACRRSPASWRNWAEEVRVALARAGMSKVIGTSDAPPSEFARSGDGLCAVRGAVEKKLSRFDGVTATVTFATGKAWSDSPAASSRAR